MKSFTELHAWQRGMDLVEEIYLITKKFHPDERFGLTAQIRKAANSVVANTAEGFGRSTSRDKANKYTIARGECTEVHAFVLIAIRLKFLPEQEASKAMSLSIETGKLLSGLIQKYSS
ncbi:four helix bundle protein [Candidatus Peregrinibacteria bacterium]|nr:four helix bundle protein [Candidatus Peregrinibacteria bacterium]